MCPSSTPGLHYARSTSKHWHYVASPCWATPPPSNRDVEKRLRAGGNLQPRKDVPEVSLLETCFARGRKDVDSITTVSFARTLTGVRAIVAARTQDLQAHTVIAERIQTLLVPL